MNVAGFYLVSIVIATVEAFMRPYGAPFMSPMPRSNSYFNKELERNFTFPMGFLFGAATSSYQAEGGWNEDGRGVSIWDTLTHQHPEYIADFSNGDVACDSYHLYKEDVQLLKNLGVQFYRFSISWSRILPTGHVNTINQAGIDYYNNLINELIANGIRPLVTMYHWDLPQPLQDLGGWANPVMADYFEDFAYLLFSNFGDRVKVWVTFNEPDTFYRGYGNPRFAPAVNAPGIGEYLVAKTVLLSHAKVYHLYQTYFKGQQQGKIGLALNIHWCEPLRNHTNDLEACERYQQFRLGLFAHPIYSHEGDFPYIVKERIEHNSLAEGFRRSRLPILTQEDIKFIRGTWDFFGLNHYTTVYGTDGEEGTIPSINRDAGIITTQDPSWPSSGSSWLKIVPWGFRKQLNWIAQEYNNPPVLITEIGYSDLPSEGLNDINRIQYYTSYMIEMLKAIYEDDCNIIGLSAWSLLDNFEWNRGYTEKFGLYKVDFNDPSRTRSPKDSVQVFTEIIRMRQIPARYRYWYDKTNTLGYNTSLFQDYFPGVTDNSIRPHPWLPDYRARD